MSKTPQELAQTVKDAAKSAAMNRARATQVGCDTKTGKRHYATYERQMARMENALAELLKLAEKGKV